MSVLLRRRGTEAKTAPFDPLTKVTALHAVWAGDTAWSHPADGAAVSSWRNQSGGGDPAQATGGAQPLYRATVSQLGNKPGVEFDGTDDLLDFNVTDTAQPFKTICVFRLLATTVNKRVYGTGAATNNGFGLVTGDWRLTNGVSLDGGTPDTVGHVLRTTNDGASSQYWVDGSSVASGDASTGAYARIKLGASGTTAGANFCNCQIGFFAVYAGATSDAVLATLAADLKTHYGL